MSSKCHQNLNAGYLPRQARDKHRENSKQDLVSEQDTNLAMVILPNNSAVGLLRTIRNPESNPNLVVAIYAVTAADWRNASSYVGHWDTIQFEDAQWGPEDPFVYRDEDVFHAVFHNQVINSYAYRFVCAACESMPERRIASCKLVLMRMMPVLKLTLLVLTSLPIY